jgi:uncharacterized protein (TIGR02246 family)
MSSDEQQIRDLIAEWMRASAADDLDAVLALMSEDVVFLGPGRPPMRGRDAFARASASIRGRARIVGESDIQEVQVVGDLAWCWNELTITVTPAGGGTPARLVGPALSVLRRQPDGRWTIVRDANMVVPA